MVEEVRNALGGRLRFVFRNFPLTEVHPRAEHAAEIAEAAGAHDLYWEMHDMPSSSSVIVTFVKAEVQETGTAQEQTVPLR